MSWPSAVVFVEFRDRRKVFGREVVLLNLGARRAVDLRFGPVVGSALEEPNDLLHNPRQLTEELGLYDAGVQSINVHVVNAPRPQPLVQLPRKENRRQLGLPVRRVLAVRGFIVDVVKVDAHLWRHLVSSRAYAGRSWRPARLPEAEAARE